MDGVYVLPIVQPLEMELPIVFVTTVVRSGLNEHSTTHYLRSTRPRWFWVGRLTSISHLPHPKGGGLDLLQMRIFLLRVLAMKPSCHNRIRSTLKCRQSCCRKQKKKQAVPGQALLFKRDRTCSMCKTKYYASNVQCLLGNFNCLLPR